MSRAVIGMVVGKSVQTGTLEMSSGTTQTATITSVDVNNSEISHGGLTIGPASGDFKYFTYLTLTNATTVTCTEFEAPGSSSPTRYFVRELYPGLYRSIQRGTIDVNGGTSATATISSVTTTKAIVQRNGSSINIVTPTLDQFVTALALTNATTVTTTIKANPGASNVTAYQVPETY